MVRILNYIKTEIASNENLITMLVVFLFTFKMSSVFHTFLHYKLAESMEEKLILGVYRVVADGYIKKSDIGKKLLYQREKCT